MGRCFTNNCWFCLCRFQVAHLSWWKAISMTSLQAREEHRWLLHKCWYSWPGEESNWYPGNYYPNYDHVLIYDNVTTHLKHAEDGLSARYMPKNVPKQGSNWGIEVSVCDPATGKLVYHPDGTVRKSRSEWEMHNLRTADLNLSIIQRITLIQIYEEFLKAWRLSSRNEALQTLTCMTWKKKLLAQCNKFECTPGETKCCMCCILYNQPDFTQAELLLEMLCWAWGVEVILWYSPLVTEVTPHDFYCLWLTPTTYEWAEPLMN